MDGQFQAPVVDVSALGLGDAVLVAQEYVRLRQWEQVRSFCYAWTVAHGEKPAVSACLALAHFALGDRQDALRLIDGVLARDPTHLTARLYKAQMLVADGRSASRDEALRQLREIVDREPEFPGALGALSAVLLPGPTYRQVLAAIHRLLGPRTYLEIGVESGASLALAGGAEVAVGIDPVRAHQVPLPANARFFEQSSDAFFASQTRDAVFGGRGVDLAFIDGLHLFEQVLRDFFHVERWSHPGTVVVFHDCLPTHLGVATRERRTTFWTGDTWKAFEILRSSRPDLALTVIPTAPSGLLVARRLDARSEVFDMKLRQFVEQWVDAPYPYQPGKWPPEFNIVSNDEAGIRRAVGL